MTLKQIQEILGRLGKFEHRLSISGCYGITDKSLSCDNDTGSHPGSDLFLGDACCSNKS